VNASGTSDRNIVRYRHIKEATSPTFLIFVFDLLSRRFIAILGFQSAFQPYSYSPTTVAKCCGKSIGFRIDELVAMKNLYQRRLARAAKTSDIQRIASAGATISIVMNICGLEKIKKKSTEDNASPKKT